MTVSGRVCVVTGATSGIGLATVRRLAADGARVALVARDRDRGRTVSRELDGIAGGEPSELFVADLSRMSDVRRLAGEIATRFPRVHVLVNNAGAVHPRPRSTVDGFEETLAVNYLAPFLLTRLLLPALDAAAPARIVNVASRAHADSIDPETLREISSGGLAAYRRAKLATILFTLELGRRLTGRGVVANCLHPGVVSTRLLEEFAEAARGEKTESGAGTFRRALRRGLLRLRWKWTGDPNLSPEQACATTLFLAGAEEAAFASGGYYEDCREARPAEAALDPELARRLWEFTSEMLELPVETDGIRWNSTREAEKSSSGS